MQNAVITENNGRTRVLVISDRDIPLEDGGDHEARDIAAALARDHDVILALPATTGFSHRDFAVIYYNRRNLGLVAKDSEAVICGREVFEANGFFNDSGRAAVASLPRLRQGVIEAIASPDALAATGKQYYIWTPPEPVAPSGIGHSLARLRFLLRQGGVRYTLRRAMAAARRHRRPGG